MKCALAGAAIAAVLAAGYVSVGYAASAGSAASAGPTDTSPPPETTPSPDPAPPPPKPTPKPASKPAPKPATTYHAPVQHSTPATQPTYTPPAVAHPVTKPKVVHHARRHKRAQHVVTTPKVKAQVKDASVVHINAVPTAATAASASDAVRRSLVISGIGLAALLFLLVLAVPVTAARFTPPGRVLMDHQTDLVLVGVAILALTALLFAVTGNG